MSAFAESKYFYGPGSSAVAVNLTPEQRALANTLHGELLASAIERETNRDGGRWFSAGRLAVGESSMAVVRDGERLGLWIRRDGKDYWRFNERTWPWVRTALALAEERSKNHTNQPAHIAH